MFKFRLREPDRGRKRFRSREWWLVMHKPVFFWKRCHPDCQVGTSYYSPEFDQTFEYDHRKDCPRAPKYVGHVAKGWWSLWTWGDDLWMWSSEIVFAIGGEDNMAQFSVQLPILGRASVGVKVPRSWTKRWIYERREFGIELRGLWPTLLIAHDTSMDDMHDYYVREYRGQGKPLPDHVAGLKLWPGWRLRVRGVQWARLKNRVLGPHEFTDTVLKVYDPVTVTLPEGDYPGKVTFYRSTLKRKRSPRARRDEVYGKFESEQWMPWPGKGENSWDCGDDGTKENTERIGSGRMKDYEIDGSDVAKVLGGTVAKVLKYRARYGRFDWQPDGVGVMRD